MHQDWAQAILAFFQAESTTSRRHPDCKYFYFYDENIEKQYGFVKRQRKKYLTETNSFKYC